jgi:hypothetical protein
MSRVRFEVSTAVTMRMASSGMLRRVALVITDVSEEPVASITRVTRIGELGTTLPLTSNRSTLRRNTKFLGRYTGQPLQLRYVPVLVYALAEAISLCISS